MKLFEVWIYRYHVDWYWGKTVTEREYVYSFGPLEIVRSK